MEPAAADAVTSLVVEPDEALWLRSLDGDGEAFAALFDRYRERVFRHACRLAETRQEAEDVVASAFLELWRRRATVRLIEGSVLPWLLVRTTDLGRNAARASLPHHQQARVLFNDAQASRRALDQRREPDRGAIAPATDASHPEAAREAIAALGVGVHQPTEAVGVDAARFRARHPISVPDAYLLANARPASAAIATFDRKVQQAARREGLTLA